MIAGDPAACRESLEPAEKLHRRSEFQRCYRQGRRRGGALATLHVARNEAGSPRLGITVTRKVGKAVVRQLLKRRVREIYRRWPGRWSLPSVDVVVHLKPTAREADFEALREELLRQLRSVGEPSRRTR